MDVKCIKKCFNFCFYCCGNGDEKKDYYRKI